MEWIILQYCGNVGHAINTLIFKNTNWSVRQQLRLCCSCSSCATRSWCRRSIPKHLCRLAPSAIASFCSSHQFSDGSQYQSSERLPHVNRRANEKAKTLIVFPWRSFQISIYLSLEVFELLLALSAILFDLLGGLILSLLQSSGLA